MLEKRIESLIFQARWLLAPFFIGLIAAILVLMVKFFKSLYNMIIHSLSASSEQTIVNILTLVDTALLAGLLLIIIFSGYENFVSKLNIGDHEDRPAWMGKVGFSDLKQKLIGAIVAISAVELLKTFINSQAFTGEELMWKVILHLSFVASGVLFALTDYISERGKNLKAQ
ncbi:TIGR00645 family protein [Motilimonas pumila]|uniref:UPF0114 protein D1Z90_06960 n=1 Tax=Motilimonas pumila TaxID=2303987 RepID=A0A418YGW2_9GAMM|nr:TIGR00645 family protein [Motilimonas pumila]RJG49098.1 TIGR00645 family protein [Motilimonas pumila]